MPDTDNIVPLQEVALDDALKRTGKAKMPTSTEIVLRFLDQCGKGKAVVKEAFHAYFTSNTIWENVGLLATGGVDEVLDSIDKCEISADITHLDADMRSIAIEGDRVLTERVDRLLTSKGEVIVTLRVMGIFELADGKSTAWRDYFD